jgi:excisionase family DNA binding protein
VDGVSDEQSRDFVILPSSELGQLIERAVIKALKVANDNHLVDRQEIAQRLGVSPSQVDRLRKQGLPVVMVGENVRFQPAKVIAWLKESGAA